MCEVDLQTLKMLEFNKVLEMAARFAVTAPAKKSIYELRPNKTAEDVIKRLNLITECRKLLSEGISIGIEHFEDLSHIFRLLRPEESVIEPMQLRSFIPVLNSAINLKKLKNEKSIHLLSELLSCLITHKEIKDEIEISIEDDGSISDKASPLLYEIRQKIKALDKKIKSVLERMLNDKKLKPHIQDFYITERNGRRVIPVKANSKGHIKGVIHDISNTSETVFVEPQEIIQMGNELEALKAEERIECYKVLKRLSKLLREHLSEIQQDYNIIIIIDTLQALALFAEEMKMTSPEINHKGYLKIVKGKHPILWKTLKDSGRIKELVPLEFVLGDSFTGIIITGSNTGGKTVALKTVGIIQLMALVGMHVPADEGTTLPFIHKVIADIGDEQSIEESLSTFSAHVNRLCEILKLSNNSTLVIIDELGTGTDPDEGGALGASVLKALIKKGSLIVVSTHLGLLKAFAYKHKGLNVGAMKMDTFKINDKVVFKPTYRLQIGEIGESHALDIAEAFGMPSEIIEEAKKMLKNKSAIFEELLNDLKNQQLYFKKTKEEIIRNKKEILILKDSLKKEINRIKKQKNEIIKNALEKAEDILKDAKIKAYRLLNDIKKTELKKSIKELNRAYEEIVSKKNKFLKHKNKKISKLTEGQKVFIEGLGLNGIVTRINPSNDRCRVTVMGKEIEVSISELYEPKNENNLKEKNKIDYYSLKNIPRELNLIGERVSSALSLVDKYLNDAALTGITEVKIIHGIGTGRLSKAIKEYLQTHPLVTEFREGTPLEGGKAVTVVILK